MSDKGKGNLMFEGILQGIIFVERTFQLGYTVLECVCVRAHKLEDSTYIDFATSF
jgi:hypothetical protein